MEETQPLSQSELPLCDSLIIWLQTFNTTAPCQDVKQLTNGVAMAQVLHQIDMAWFNESWLSRIKEDIGDNWRIKASNLKKVLQGIMSYYNEFLGQQISEELIPDLNQITECSDSVELGRLLQLILGCAVNCEKKQEHIQNIMTLEESVQHVVMTAIQEVSCIMITYLKRALEELQEAQAEKEELRQRCQELDMQNEMMNEKLDHLFVSEKTNDGNNIINACFLYARLEAAKDDYRVHCEELEKQLIEFQHRNDELTSLAEETRALKDEIDVLRYGLSKYNYQVKTLQETNMMYMHNTAIRNIQETVRQKVQDLHRLEEKHEALLKEKERLIEQRDTLKETNEELRCSQVQQDHLNQTDTSATKSYENLAAEIMPVEYRREVFIRLQHENKMLRLQQEGTENERIEELQEQLDQKHRKMNELETEQSKERIRELQQQIEDLQKSLQEQGSKSEGESVSNLKFMGILLRMLHNRSWCCNPYHLWLQKISELEAALQKKDEDMKAMEERYKMYLEKKIQKQLAEKERRIEILESECKVAKFRDYEEKLIVSAWYNKSLAFQKLGMESRLVSGSGTCRDTGACAPARSFLAQQRHITSTRRNLSVKVPATTAD
uniref:Hook microtubule tethering protein 1 n=1 Tax=Sus scrofa TaxID=9823 RepID=A0A4X1W5N8_PIG